MFLEGKEITNPYTDFLWNRGWEFTELTLEEASYEIPKKADWQQIELPHDWMIYDTKALYRDSIGWYKKTLEIQEADAEERMFLRFEGVYMDSTVYVNGQAAGEWKYGYSTFEVDITPFVKTGENEVLVRVVHRSPNSRWYSGAGIYRNVWLKCRNKTGLVSDGVYITPEKKTETFWKVKVTTELGDYNETVSKEWDRTTIEQHILDAEGNPIAFAAVKMDMQNWERTEAETTAPVGEQRSFYFGRKIRLEMQVEQPKLWDIGQGNLYTLQTKVMQGDKCIEEKRDSFGFRTLEMTPDKGMFINGRHVKLNGVCEHHDFGCLGAEFYDAAMERKFKILREMGVNAVRTSHNMPAPKLMELADKMGILVVSEGFDMWECPKTTYDYARFFKEWYKRDVASWVRRDRNHACLLMWSIGNEIYDTHMSEHGQEITVWLRDAVRVSDPERHAAVTIGSNFMRWENAQKCAELIDVVGYNYAEEVYEEHHKAHPDWIIYGSETASVLASRGIYHFPKEKSILTDEDKQCSALGNSITGWGAEGYIDCIGDDRDAEFSLGQFLWTGFDYIGEPTPYDTKNSYFGQLDTAGFPKDAYYIFKAEWTDYKTAPMVHIFPYWDFNEGQLIDVQICSNAPRIELFINGESQGTKDIDHTKGKEQVGLWKIPYKKGSIKAVAYDENGTVIAQEEKKSFTDSVRLTIKADKKALVADGRDLLYVEIGAEDVDGNPVENARNRVFVEVEGAGKLLGLDNGDSTDFDQYKGSSRRMFSGKLMAVIGADTEPGEVHIKCSSPGLEECKLVLPVSAQTAAGTQEKTAAGEKVVSSDLEKVEISEFENGEIPVRKIELSLQGSSVLTKEQPSVVAQARIYPENATYRELEWSVVNDTGIGVSFVTLKTAGEKAEIEAKGDGEFRLRCSSRNGGEVVSVQSVMEMKVEGIGKAFMNPYNEIPAGLCTYRYGKAGDGVEHGMGFMGAEDSLDAIIGFENLDFGEDGSDSIVLPIFANTNDPVTLQIWEGNPREEGCVLLGDFSYFKPPQWMVFQPETYKLKKRLRGVVPVYITSSFSFQLKGIFFEKQTRALAQLSAAECDSVYGDSYIKKEDCIENIGNNVLLTFESMDFGVEGVSKLTLCSRSRQEANSVQLRFTSKDGTVIQTVEAKGNDVYDEQTFQIQNLKGKGKLEFVFLPGTQFDFKWFWFQ